jgi:hypothetical protein
MDKKLLSLAVAAGLASSSAMAVDLDAGTGSNAYATELTIDAAPGTALAEIALNDVTVNAGFAISASTERYMRFDISGATIGAAGAALAVAETIIASGLAGAGAVDTVSAGGAVGDTFVIFEVKANASNSVTATNNAVFNTPELDVLTIGPIGVTYALYANALDAVNNTTASALATKSGTIATAAAATTTTVNATVAAATPAPLLIDVGDNGLTFAGGVATTNIGQIVLADVAGINGKDGTTDVTHATKASANALVVTGDFSATQDLTLGVPDGTYTLASVFLDHTSNFDCGNSDVAATAITATSATLAVPNAADTVAVCITTNGVSTILPGSYTAVMTPTASANFTTPAVSLTLGTLAKNGSSTTLDLALSPTGAYPSFVRVSNTAAVAGDVTITLINDDGVSSGAFALGTVAGQTTSSLGAGASTTLLSMADLMAAAQVASPTFASGTNSNKFRVTIDGEFGTIAAQSVTTSVDGNSFSTF